ncbi:hypothetical protein [Planctomycetes bacterium TBK1r]|uniref:Uncharacterized protein n=1 Tax=Stieleria magnilauensis TaxID=2527963 RepID=A0ABX5Y300_9BACT|nr:hypothetical protein TBK1r_63610 [Planctomycetes bacterium TBK1r]
MRFSLRSVMVGVVVVSLAMAWVRYKLPVWQTQRKIDSAYYALDVNNDAAIRAGSSIMLNISQATFESLEQTKLVGAWVNEPNRTLHLAALSNDFDASEIEIRTLGGDVVFLPIPAEQLAESEKRERHTIDHRVSVALPEGMNATDLYDRAAVRYRESGYVVSGWFPVFAIFTANGRTMRS